MTITTSEPMDESGMQGTVNQKQRYQRISSDELFNGQPIVEIEHQGKVYRLHKTRDGNLTLTR